MSEQENNKSSEEQTHGHAHGIIDSSLTTSEKGLWAVKVSSIVLFLGACFQLVIVLLSGSVSLLSDTIHNFGDSATALPLGLAFLVTRKKPSKSFTYGYGKIEDVAGVSIILFMLASALYSGYISLNRLFHPFQVTHLWVVIAASLVGFAINEGAAIFRIKMGKQIHSEALITDGKHARMDGITSLSVLVGAAGIMFGYPLADPLVGLFITGIILYTIWGSGKTVFSRLLDGVDPSIIDEIKHEASHVKGVSDVTDTRVRWIGHRLHAEVNITVNPSISVAKGHDIAKEVQHELTHHLPNLSFTAIHVDPATASGEQYHLEHH